MPQAAGQVKVLIFLVKIKFFPIYANIFCDAGQVPIFRNFKALGLENSTRPLVFTSVLGCSASENFDISCENYFFPCMVITFCDVGQVLIIPPRKLCL